MPYGKSNKQIADSHMKKTSGFKMKGWSAFTKPDDDKKKKKANTKTGAAEVVFDKVKNQEFVPAWPGADISKQKWDSMTPKEKENYKGE